VGFGSDFEAGCKTFSFSNQGMLVHCWQGIGQALINSYAILVDNKGFAVDWQCPTNFVPISVINFSVLNYIFP
jgi:hypothetical protein